MSVKANTPGRLVIRVQQHPGDPVPPPMVCVISANAPPGTAPLVLATRWMPEGLVLEYSGSTFPTPGSYKIWLQPASGPPGAVSILPITA